MDTGQQAQEEELKKLIETAEEKGTDELTIEAARALGDGSKASAIMFLRKAMEKDLQSKVAYSHSIEHIYGSTHGEFKLPPLRLNKAAPPSKYGGITMVGAQDSDGKPTGEKITVEKAKAKIFDLEDVHYVPTSDVRIPTKRENGELIQSGLAGDLDISSDKELRYANEAEVQNFCFTMLKDALKCLGLSSSEVSPHLEVSIYTMRPDILLVLRREGRIIFIIEVKCPELKDGDVYQSEQVAGQIASYLMALHSLGDETPMGAIMTYNKIALVTIADYKDGKSFRKAVEKTKNQLRTERTPTRDRPEQKVDCQNRTETPLKHVSYYTDQTQSKAQTMRRIYKVKEGEKDEHGDQKVELEAHMSTVHKDEEVFPFLLQALQLAYYKGDGVKDNVVDVNNKDNLGNRLTFKVSESSFDWVETREECVASIDQQLFALHQNKYFYILGKLGEGNVAAVYLAASTNGSVCAMKSYYLKPSTGLLETDERNRGLVEQMSKLEKDRWETLYQERGFKARSLWLGGSPCLLMPYGRTLVQHDSNSTASETCFDGIRWRAVSKIKAELKRFATLGFVYSQSDLRWGHVLVDQEKKIFFCDLESLVPFEVEEKNAEVVAWDQLKVLVKPMMNNEDGNECLLDWVQEQPEEVKNIILDEDLQDLIGAKNGDPDDRLASLFPDGTTHQQLSAEATVCLHALWFFKKEPKSSNGKTGSPNSDSAAPSLETDRSVNASLGDNENENEGNANDGYEKEGNNSDEDEKEPETKTSAQASAAPKHPNNKRTHEML